MKSIITAGRLALAAVLTIAGTSLVQAQTDAPPVGLNQPVQGELSSRDPRLSEDGVFKLYRFDAEAGRTYDIQLRSSAFSPALTVARTVGGVTDHLTRSTDHGLGAGALIHFAAPSSGQYLVLARSADQRLGSYTLTISPAAGEAGQPLMLGQAVNHWVESEAFHSVPADAAVELEITARSREFDTVLEAGYMVDGTFVAAATDDDSAGATDSRIYFTPERRGDFLVRVAPYGDGDGGSYSVVVLEAPALAEPQPLPVGSTMRGELRENSTSLADGSPYADWVLDAIQGDRFRIEVTSGDFDTNVAVGTIEARQLVELASNDDSGDPDMGSSDSLLNFSAFTDGPFIVRVTPYGGEGTGAYTIRVTELPPLPTTPLGGSIQPESTVRGELGSEDAILGDGAPYQEWCFQAAQGESFEVSLASDDFDTHLFVGRIVGGSFVEVASNDDWESSVNGTDSQLVFEAPAGGGYVIRVRPYSAGVEGEYTLTLARAVSRTAAAVTTGRISAGETVTGTLTDEDARLEDDSPYELWYFRANAGRSYTIDLLSSDFDAYLSLGRMVGGEYLELAGNDDYAIGTDSRIEYTFPESGEYVIRANVLLAEERGAYTLRITSGLGGASQAFAL